MATHFRHHSVATLADSAGVTSATVPIKVEVPSNDQAMTFQNFKVAQVLQQGTVLMASGGQVG